MIEDKKLKVELFTDGACKGNPGPGGWGVLLRSEKSEKQLYGGEFMTTNNRMELLAVIKGLEALKNPCQVTITTDSKYVHDGISIWLINWKKRGWKTSNNKPVKNIDLWQELEKQIERHQVSWQWVRGHNGHKENELADQLANQGVEEVC